MKVLLDTHALLWWWTDDAQLSPTARAILGDPACTIFVSAASAWEIATKHRLGKLPGLAEALSRFNELVLADGFRHLPVSYLHSLKAGSYPWAHRDPFDRMLVAQSEIESLVLLSCDSALADCGARLFW
jgi:PIN domain nuclease of toxin-antitoxin system